MKALKHKTRRNPINPHTGAPRSCKYQYSNQATCSVSSSHNSAIPTDRPLRYIPHPHPSAMVADRIALSAICAHQRTISVAIAVRPRAHISIVAVVSLWRFVLLRVLFAGCRVRCEEGKAFHACRHLAERSVDPSCRWAGRVGGAVVVACVPFCC